MGDIYWLLAETCVQRAEHQRGLYRAVSAIIIVATILGCAWCGVRYFQRRTNGRRLLLLAAAILVAGYAASVVSGLVGIQDMC